MKGHQISVQEEYRHIEVSSDFADTHEIEYSTPESFLYQSGYLTIEKSKGDTLTLDYPNEEVRKSLIRMYLDEIYHVKRYITFGTKLQEALSSEDITLAVELYNKGRSWNPNAEVYLVSPESAATTAITGTFASAYDILGNNVKILSDIH